MSAFAVNPNGNALSREALYLRSYVLEKRVVFPALSGCGPVRVGEAVVAAMVGVDFGGYCQI